MIIQRHSHRHVRGALPAMDPLELDDILADRDDRDEFGAEIKADRRGVLRAIGVSFSSRDEQEG